MALGAGGVLLFAGAFPLLGAPALYRGGAMLLLGVLLGVLSLWGALRLARGNAVRFLCGLFASFMAVIGLVMVLRYGGKAWDYAGIGGAMWFGAMGMGCIAMVGVLFTSLFGFLAHKLMLPRLWLAGAHVAAAAVLVGAFVDFCAETRQLVRLPADGKELLTTYGSAQPLPFQLRADAFDIDYYEGKETYSLMEFDHASANWRRLGAVEQKDGQLCFAEERWNAAQLRGAPGMPRPFLLAGARRVILQDAPAVKEYRAQCLVKTKHRGRDEQRVECLKVNEPVEVKGWQICLMSHEQAADGTPRLVLQLRHAPGRFWSLAGMVGLILCTACWCWGGGRVLTDGKEVEHA